MRDVEVSNWTEIISAEAFFSSYAYSFESQIFQSRYIHCKCLQGITWTMQGKSAISMEKGCNNHRVTLYSSKGKIAYIVEKPCNTYRLGGNPVIIMGFPRNLTVNINVATVMFIIHIT